MTEAMTAGVEAPSVSRGLTMLVAGGLFMETLDGSVIVTALPEIGAGLRCGAAELTLSITGYLAALAALTPTSRWLSDRYGAARMFAISVAGFTIASALCGLAPSAPSFIAARIAQGAAAAFMSPVGRAMVLRAARPETLVRLVATMTWPGLIAPVIGPPLGGYLAAIGHWRWIFFLNIPVGILGVSLMRAWAPWHDRTSGPRTPFDTFGFVAVSLTLAGLVFGLDEIARGAVLAGLLVALFAGICAAIAIRHELLTDHPLLDLRVLDLPQFRQAVLTAGLLVRTAISTAPYLIPLMFQLAFRFSVFKSGMFLLVYMSGNLLMKVFTTPLLNRFTYRLLLTMGSLVVALSLLLTGSLKPSDPLGLLVGVLFVAGLARSLVFTGWTTFAFADVPNAHRGDATSMAATLQQLATSLGVSGAALALELHRPAGQALALGDFRTAFWVAAAVATVATVLTLRVPLDAAAAGPFRSIPPPAPERSSS